jgi:hypothetical protein
MQRFGSAPTFRSTLWKMETSGYIGNVFVPVGKVSFVPSNICYFYLMKLSLVSKSFNMEIQSNFAAIILASLKHLLQ